MRAVPPFLLTYSRRLVKLCPVRRVSSIESSCGPIPISEPPHHPFPGNDGRLSGPALVLKSGADSAGLVTLSSPRERLDNSYYDYITFRLVYPFVILNILKFSRHPPWRVIVWETRNSGEPSAFTSLRLVFTCGKSPEPERSAILVVCFHPPPSF